MMRCTVIMRWTPEKTPDVMKKVGAIVRGEAPPEVLEAYKKIKVIAAEVPSYYGQTVSVTVVEGEEADISVRNRYFMDVATLEVLPSVSIETLLKMYYP